MKATKSTWVCINCGVSLGEVMGGELYPSVEGKYLRTHGPNLDVTCPECGAKKVFYTSDPIVRSIYQLVGVLSDVAAKAMIEQMGRYIHEQELKKS